MMSDCPLVSIQCLVYNHEPYLRQCLDGFVMQKTDFPFEAIVHDDCSTDGSASIIKEYADKYPTIIKPIFEKENQYSKIGFSGINNIMLNQSKGKYIALCEGDDYWIDPLKLQKQVDYMEANPFSVMCYSKANIFNQTNGRFVGEYGDDSSFDKQLFHDDIPTLTMLFRKSIFEQYQNENFPWAKWRMGDMPLCMYFYKHGQVEYMREVMGVYRVLDNSASHFGEIEKAFQFMDNSLRVRLYMLDKYGSDKITKKDVAQQQLIWYLKLALKYDQEIQSFDYKAFKEQFQLYSLKNDIKFYLIKKKWGRRLLGKKNQL